MLVLKKYNRLFYIFFLFFSCGKKEVSLDFRDQLIGSYTCDIKKQKTIFYPDGAIGRQTSNITEEVLISKGTSAYTILVEHSTFGEVSIDSLTFSYKDFYRQIQFTDTTVFMYYLHSDTLSLTYNGQK